MTSLSAVAYFSRDIVFPNFENKASEIYGSFWLHLIVVDFAFFTTF